MNLSRRTFGAVRVVALSCCLVVFLAGCSFLEAERTQQVEHHVHEGRAPTYPLPTSVSHVAWEWSTEEEDGNLWEVLPGRSGPMMVLGTGVVGLDGTTGEELWSYRVDSGGLHQVRPTPDHDRVLLTRPGHEPDTAVLLDAGTGQLIAEHTSGVGASFAQASALTSDVAVVVPSGKEGPVEAFSLREGEQVWTYEPPQREGSDGVVVEEAVSAGETVVLIAAYNDGTLQDDSVDFSKQGMLVVGLDEATGKPLWEVEQEFRDENRRVAEYELSPNAEALFLDVGVGNQRYKFLIDPATGKEIDGEAYQEQERYPVGLLDDGYVETAADYDKEVVDYWRMSFQGQELARVETRLRSAEGDLDRGVPLEEGVLRLDHLTEPDLDRGPVYAEFEWWDGKEDPVVLNADMTVNEQWWGRSEGTALTLPDAPVTALVPGAVVITEESSAPWTVAGLT